MKNIIHFDHLALLKPYTSLKLAWFYVFDKQSQINIFITISIQAYNCLLLIKMQKINMPSSLLSIFTSFLYLLYISFFQIEYYA